MRTAIALKARGIKKGDVITGCSNNHLNACVPIIASFYLGALPCSLDPKLSVFEINELIVQVKPKILFTIPESLEVIKEALKNANLDTEIVVYGETSDHTSFEEFLKPSDEEHSFEPIFIDNPRETLVIYFSSGTSGFPKGICLNHFYYYTFSPLAPPVKNFQLDEERRIYEFNKKKDGSCFLNYGSPYWGSAGQGMFLSAIGGIARLLCNTFDPKEFWEMIPKYKVRAFFLFFTHVIYGSFCFIYRLH